jgi:hypothetical protein
MEPQIFIYWDDLGDSHSHVDNQKKCSPAPTPCSNHARDLEWEEKEEEWNRRMDIIGSNGNEGDHYDMNADSDIHPQHD